MNENWTFVRETEVPPGFVVVERHRRPTGYFVFAVLPDKETGLLWLDEPVGYLPPGWHLVRRDENRGPRGMAAFAPGPTWRAWRLYFAAGLAIRRALVPVARVVLLGLARLASVDMPMGWTLRGALCRLGAAIEEERRRDAEKGTR